MMTFDTPQDGLHGEALAQEIAQAIGVDAVEVVYHPREGLRVLGVDESSADTIRQIIESHVPPDPEPDPDVELDSGLAEVAARDDVPEWGRALIANLRGQAGHAGRAAGRRPT